MDVTASAITIVSSVWTLTVHCKSLIEGIKNSEESIKQLERKGNSLKTLVDRIGKAYIPTAKESDDSLLDHGDQQLQEDIRKELSCCKEDLETYDKVVEKLLGRNRTGRYRAILNIWRERIAKPTIENIGNSIADHHSYLQSLIELHHGQKLDDTRKDLKQDLKQILIAINGTCETIENPARITGLDLQDRPTPNGFSHLERRDSDSTLVNPPRNDNHESVSAIEGDDLSPLQSLAQAIARELMIQMAPPKGSISPPTDPPLATSGPGMEKQHLVIEAPTGLGIEIIGPQRTHRDDRSGYPRKASSSYATAVVSTSSPLTRADSRPSDGSLDTPSFDGPPGATMWRSASGISGSSTLADGVSVTSNKPSAMPLDDRLVGRTNKTQGAKLLQAIRSGSPEALHTLLHSDASLEERDEKAKTPLILAASLGKVDMVETLIACGADVQATDKEKASALHYAIKSSSLSVIKVLLGVRDTSNVATNGEIGINLTDKNGRTPLHWCTRLGCAETQMKNAASELIACNADIDTKDDAGKRPLYYAIKDRRYSVVELFLEKGAKLDFAWPETSAEIGKLLDDRLAGKMPSPPMKNENVRRDSNTSPRTRKPSIFSIPRRKSGPKDKG